MPDRLSDRQRRVLQSIGSVPAGSASLSYLQGQIGVGRTSMLQTLESLVNRGYVARHRNRLGLVRYIRTAKGALTDGPTGTASDRRREHVSDHRG